MRILVLTGLAILAPAVIGCVGGGLDDTDMDVAAGSGPDAVCVEIVGGEEVQVPCAAPDGGEVACQPPSRCGGYPIDDEDL